MAQIYPPVGFHFQVKFDFTSDVLDVRFQSVGGLSVEFETESFKEGGENRFEHVLPLRTKYPDLVLKRGFIPAGSMLSKWCEKAFQDQEFLLANATITLLNELHDPIKTWNVVGIYPKKWSVSEFNAENNSLVIETLELRYKYFTML